MLKPSVIFFIFVQTTLQRGCNIALFRTWDPVVFSTDLEIIYPPITNLPDDRNITLPIGSTIIISCNGGRFSLNYTTTKTIQATCNQNFQLEAQDAIFDFDKIDCVNFKPVTTTTASTSCGPNAVIIEVGFQIGLNIKFLPQVNVCFDVVNLVPLYTYFNLTKSIGFIKSYLVTQYVVDSVFSNDIDFNTLYNSSYQKKLINSLVGLPEDSTKYINPETCRTTPGFCFIIRPLTYRGALVYIPQQYSTYRYINVAPQWSFLDYNFNKLERDVINYAINNKLDLEVYTGTFKVASLPHEVTGEDVNLYLHVSEEGTTTIPVPLIFWKLVYDKITERATVFLIINNPYQSEDDVAKNVICEDFSDQITWLTWEKHNVTKGYSYACTYEDVKSEITYLPDIIVKDILV